MILGTSQIDITPQPGVELSGFAARTQPSTGVLDPLFARTLYMMDGGQKLLWCHCDLIGFDRSIVEEFRQWVREHLGLGADEVMLSATHTHSGPCTIHLREAGEYDAAYVDFLQQRLREGAQAAVSRTSPVELVRAEGTLQLAVDRRGTASAHVDQRIGALGFRRADGGFAAAVVNYPIHPVALGPLNRCISADIPGRAALALARELPGDPVVLITNGACGNLNPPAENVSAEQVKVWGEQISAAVAPLFWNATALDSTTLRLGKRLVSLPLDALDADGIDAFALKALQDVRSLAQWGDKYRRVVEHWRATLKTRIAAGRGNGQVWAELFAVCLADVILLGANAEVFSEFTDWLRHHSGKSVYVIGYANGDLGYLPTRAAYQGGGYEVDVAPLFYASNTVLPRA
jgi:neutral ceramidase